MVPLTKHGGLYRTKWEAFQLPTGYYWTKDFYITAGQYNEDDLNLQRTFNEMDTEANSVVTLSV